MLSNKPYLIRAFYEWIVDSDCTPLIVMDATFPRVNVPRDHIENGQITLNVAPQAIRDFKVSNDLVEFKASFTGIVHLISAPIKSVLAVYAQENGEGMFFEMEEYDAADDAASSEGETAWVEEPIVQQVESANQSKEANRKSVPHLKLVE